MKRASGGRQPAEIAGTRNAFVLLSVMVVVVLLSLAAYQFSDLMDAEASANHNSLKAIQTRAWAESGIHYAAGMLNDPATLEALGTPYDNPDMFSFVPVGAADAADPGYFSLIALNDPLDPNTQGVPYRFGVEDESGKINLNSLMLIDKSGELAREILLRLPEMTEDTADAILDWLDPDEDIRAFGAESETYPVYFPKNGPLNSIEELLLVRGFYPGMFIGDDRNRNGAIDPNEPPESPLPRGYSPYLTVYSREAGVAADGTPRVFLNNKDLAALREEMNLIFPPEITDFVIAFRAHGSGTTEPEDRPGTAEDLAGVVDKAIESPPRRVRSLRSVLDLVDTQLDIDTSRGQPDLAFTSPLSSEDLDGLREMLPLLMEYTTTQEGTSGPARVNINTAPPAVLATLPGLEEDDIQTILDMRPPEGLTTDPLYMTAAWLITEAEFPVENIKLVEPYITGRSTVYRVQSVGHTGYPGRVARLEAVIDVSQGLPRIAYWRDLSELGNGFNLWVQ